MDELGLLKKMVIKKENKQCCRAFIERKKKENNVKEDKKKKNTMLNHQCQEKIMRTNVPKNRKKKSIERSGCS